MDRGKSLAKNTGIIAFGTFLPRLAAFVTLPILTGYLTKEEYGTYDLITVMVSLLLPALTLQIHAAAFRFLIDSREDDSKKKTIISNVFILVVPVSLIALIVLYFVIANLADIPTRLFICLYFLAEILSVDLRQIARGLGKTLDYSISSIVTSLGTMFAAVGLIWLFRMGLFGGVVALALSSVLSSLYLFWQLEIWKLVSLSAFDEQLLKDMLGYSWPIVPSELALWVVNLSDRLIITSVLGVEVNAVYAVANKIPHIISMAQSAFTLAWQENASLAAQDEDAVAYYTEMLKVIYALQAGFFGLVIAASPLLFALLIRGDYADAYPQIPLLCLGVFFSSMSSFMGGIYVAKMATKSVGFTTIGAAIINLALNALLIKSIGLWAASLSTALSFAALFIFRMIDVRRLIAIKYDYQFMALVLVILFLEAWFCYINSIPTNIANVVLALVSFYLLNKSFVHAVLRPITSKLGRKARR